MLTFASKLTFPAWCLAAGYAETEVAWGAPLRRGVHLAWRLNEDPADHRLAREKSASSPGVPMPRRKFDLLIAAKRFRNIELRDINRMLADAKRRGIVPVTRETLTTNQSMGLYVHADRMRDKALSDAVLAWHRDQDEAALAVVIAALNAEAL